MGELARAEDLRAEERPGRTRCGRLVWRCFVASNDAHMDEFEEQPDFEEALRRVGKAPVGGAKRGPAAL
jgi:hypothetical protein